MKKIFISFAAGSQKYYFALNRLINQANDLNVFDEIIGYKEKDLKNDNYFWNKHNEFIKNNQRGYGYWIWKSYLVKKTMEKMNDGDILLYLDSGCEINSRKKIEINNLFEIVKKNYIIDSPADLEIYRNKMDLLIELNMLDTKYLYKQQRQAGAVMYLVCDITRKFINDWYAICCNYHFIDDSRSIFNNLKNFVEHRHDQSVYSLLKKKYNIDDSDITIWEFNIIYTRQNLTSISSIIDIF